MVHLYRLADGVGRECVEWMKHGRSGRVKGHMSAVDLPHLPRSCVPDRMQGLVY